MRIDVTVRDISELDDCIAFLRETQIRSVDITHVHRNVNPSDVYERLSHELGELDATVYHAAKHFLEGTIDENRGAFRANLERALQAGVKKHLIVSGHPRKTFDSIEALQTVFNSNCRGAEMNVAYNPFFDPSRLREEHERLERKLAFPFVTGVYFQMGMDTNKLRKGVEFVRSIHPELSLYGAVPVPSERTLNRLKLMALYGVFLPNSYLLSVEIAQEMTQAMMAVYNELAIEPVVFAPHLSDLSEVRTLFR